MRRTSLALIASLLATAPLGAQEFTDPTWPCIQRKVADLSVGQMLPYVIPDAPEDAALEAEVKQLSAPLSLRRFELEEVEPWVADFAADHPGNAALGALYRAAFDRIDTQRQLILRGIGRYAEKQTGLSERIDAAREEMAGLVAAEAPDFDRVDALEEQLDWDERIYRDRARALTYVCESPVLLEKRAYGLAQIVTRHWEE